MKKFLYSNLFFLFFLALSVFAVYGKSISFEFISLDDDILILNNIDYISNIKNIPNFFTNSCYYSDNYYYYRPILTLSFSVESMFFGPNPKIYHLTNMILFILSIYLMYVFLSKLKLTLNKNILKCICILMSVHPIFTSSIVWVSARNDTLLVAFLMLSLINLVNYLEQNRFKHLILYTLFFTIALFTKETAIILIPVYMLFIYTFNYKITKKQIIVSALILFPIITTYFILRHLSVASIDIKNYLNWQEYVENIFKGIMTYIEKFIVPDYIPTMLYKIKLGIKAIIVNIVFLTLLGFLYVKKIINRKIIIFCAVWFIVCLLPTFFQLEYAFLTHRLIISSVAIVLILSLITTKIIMYYPESRKYLISFFILLVFVFTYASFMQSHKYKDSNVFWFHAYLDAPRYHLTCHGLAKQYLYAGNYPKAKELFYEAKKLKNLYDYDLSIVTVFIAEGNLDKAEDLLLRLLEKKEKLTTLRYLSEIYYVKGNIKKSCIYAQKALKVDPNDPLLLKHLKRLSQ
ncbi:MAG: glycosyltransferase family 39 protein [Endomicrobiaceae bacterium]|nr:glycosyltransferase family 39 protein [Endomicrobiaceae bacterium]